MSKPEIETKDETPKFGRLLLVLIAVVVFILLLTWQTASYYQV